MTIRHALCTLLLAVAVPAAQAGDGMGGASTDATTDSIDAVARDYVELALGAHMLDPEMVTVNDPKTPALARAQAAKRDAATIERELVALQARLSRIQPGTDRLDAMRWRSLQARLESLRFQMQPPDTPKPSVSEDVQRKFGFVPQFPALSDYDAAIDRLDAAMPGEGSLSERIEAMRTAATVPPDRVEPVFRAALAECRKRTARHIALPQESIDLQFPDNTMFPGQATYAGNGRSVVKISPKVPGDVDRMLQLACHEAYPGHHLHFVSNDLALYRERGWVEFAVELESGPFVPVAEAVAEHGTGLTFPVDERIAFERDVLYPLAGLKMQHPQQWRAFIMARSSLLGASSTVARDFLAGTIDRDEAHRRFVRYRLMTANGADKILEMLAALGSYIIASDMGWYTMDRAMQGRSVDEQWRLLAQIEHEPMLLDDLATLGGVNAGAAGR